MTNWVTTAPFEGKQRRTPTDTERSVTSAFDLLTATFLLLRHEEAAPAEHALESVHLDFRAAIEHIFDATRVRWDGRAPQVTVAVNDYRSLCLIV
jgi:hypothetical protein